MKKISLIGPILIALFLMAGDPVSTAVTAGSDIPPELDRWKNWVLHNQNQAFCPIRYNDGNQTICVWTTRIKLDLDQSGGRFELYALTFDDIWITLPGDDKFWPQKVTADGDNVAVILHNQRPSVRLNAGEHLLTGRFDWNNLPEMLPVPVDLGLLELSINQNKISLPQIDGQGRLWLKKSNTAPSSEDSLKVQVFRLLDDKVPMQVTTLLRLDVSGQAREIELEESLLPDSIPMAIDSALPARITEQKRLNVQARAGRWEIYVTARLKGPQSSISAGRCIYGNQVWSFRPRHSLRMVEIDNVPPIEPGQTQMPQNWRSLQAFLIKPESTMVLRELRRGDPEPQPDQILLQRIYWLDFDGKGMTISDKISGTLSRQWYLTANPPMILGRISADGENRVITRQGSKKNMGIELRKGDLNIEADARLPDALGTLASVGWDHDIHQLSAVLNLPPGWRLFATRGIDGVSYSWVEQWSLLDFFIVLIIALSVGKLRSWPWGLAALAAMVLISHESGAPRLVWLHILPVLALLPLLPFGWFKRLVTLWGIGAGIVLLAVTINFSINQIRAGIYPQLTSIESAPYMLSKTLTYDSDQLARKAAAPSPRSLMESSALDTSISQEYPDSSYREQTSKLLEKEPDAVVPTGPGLPDWHWQSIHLKWNGPVSKDQTLKFYLLGPRLNLLLAFLRVGFLLLLIFALIDFRSIWQKIRLKEVMTGMVLLVVASALLFNPKPSMAEEKNFPPQFLLEELKQRLLEKPDCLSHCADINRMELSATNSDLEIKLEVSSAANLAVPLPVNAKAWTPDQILLDYSPIKGLVREKAGQLWAYVPAGLHILVLTSRITDLEMLQIPLPLKPHATSFSVKGWRIEGLDSDGRPGSVIELARLAPERKRTGTARSYGLPPFLNVERQLDLGLTFQTITRVTRLTPADTPAVIKIPLLAGESVTTAGIAVKNRHALINFSPNQSYLEYTANLKMSSEIELNAPTDVPWTETWILRASPIWHCELDGIAVVHHQNKVGKWQPQWQPWPGENVSIKITRPAAAKAQSKTIDKAELILTPGKRLGSANLNLTLRTSRGGQYAVKLPQKAELQQVSVNGANLPARQEKRQVTIPLQPGKQDIRLSFQHMAPFTSLFKAPPVDIGQAAVNAKVTIKMPDQRWVLFTGGPRWGPAVLFWSYLAVIVLAALLLGQIKIVPLKIRHWVLLGLGLSHIPVFGIMLISGWLIALGVRQSKPMPDKKFYFNAIQAGLILWTLAALVALLAAVKGGLLGMPEMQIAGNHSSYKTLHWTQDHIEKIFFQPWVISLPVWVYRVLMLVWSLWLSLALLKWLQWGWRCLTKDGLWRKIVWRRSIKNKTATAEKE